MSFNVDNLNEQKKQELLKTVSGGRRPHAVLVDGGTEKEREEIAYLLGFCSPTYFCYVFKKKFGISPSLFSKN